MTGNAAGLVQRGIMCQGLSTAGTWPLLPSQCCGGSLGFKDRLRGERRHLQWA